jgi:hypothetical protein
MPHVNDGPVGRPVDRTDSRHAQRQRRRGVGQRIDTVALFGLGAVTDEHDRAHRAARHPFANTTRERGQRCSVARRNGDRGVGGREILQRLQAVAAHVGALHRGMKSVEQRIDGCRGGKGPLPAGCRHPARNGIANGARIIAEVHAGRILDHEHQLRRLQARTQA